MMHSNYEGARLILLSRATTLEGLAAEVGLTAAELFDGISFDGIDLTDEKIEVLVGINADYTGAILSRQQKRILENTPIKRLQYQQEIAQLRIAEILRFIEDAFLEEYYSIATQVLADPLRNEHKLTGGRKSFEMNHPPVMVRFIVSDSSRLRTSISSALEKFLTALKRIKFPIGHRLLEVWPKEPHNSGILYQPDRLSDAIDFDYCTEKFVMRWLDYFEVFGENKERPTLTDSIKRYFGRDLEFKESRPNNVAGATSAGDEDRQDALRLAITAPSRPPASYIEDVLGRARSNEELRSLVAAIRPSAMDQAVSAAAARRLAQGATSKQSISATLTDTQIHFRILSAFRRLLVAINTPQSRRALLETVADLGEQASGLEVDAVVADLSFEETMRTLRPYWIRLTPHHQNIARTALLGKATSAVERSRATRL